jgi:hypothetical protein
MSTVSKHAIHFLFSTLNCHLYDNFDRFNQQVLTAMKSHRRDFVEEYIKFLNHCTNSTATDFTLDRLASFLFYYFTNTNPISHGDFALEIISHIKNHTVTWANEELKQFCSTFTSVSIHHTDTSDSFQNVSANISSVVTNTISSNSINSTSSQNLFDKINDSIRNLQKDQNENINKQLNAFLNLSLTRNAKEEHLNDLQVLYDKLVFKQNAFSINKSYLDNDILPKSLLQFPEPRFKDDPMYIHGFNNLKKEYQVKVLNYNSDYLKNKEEELELEIKNKVEFISKFDNKINDKLGILKTEASKKHEKQLKASNEKIQKLINKKMSISNGNAQQSEANTNTSTSNLNSANHTNTHSNQPRINVNNVNNYRSNISQNNQNSRNNSRHRKDNSRDNVDTLNRNNIYKSNNYKPNRRTNTNYNNDYNTNQRAFNNYRTHRSTNGNNRSMSNNMVNNSNQNHQRSSSRRDVNQQSNQLITASTNQDGNALNQ